MQAEDDAIAAGLAAGRFRIRTAWGSGRIVSSDARVPEGKVLVRAVTGDGTERMALVSDYDNRRWLDEYATEDWLG